MVIKNQDLLKSQQLAESNLGLNVPILSDFPKPDLFFNGINELV